MEYYSVMKKNEILPFAMRWMGPENVLLAKCSQSGKDKYHVISPMCEI